MHTIIIMLFNRESNIDIVKCINKALLSPVSNPKSNIPNSKFNESSVLHRDSATNNFKFLHLEVI